MSKINSELKDDPLMPLRHSVEHILHMSVEKLFKDAHKVMGPAIENGFYGDFDTKEKISEEDLDKLEKLMREIIKENLPIEIKKISESEAKEVFKDNKYKLEIIEDIKQRGEDISVCEVGKRGNKYYDIDICAGPHVKNTSDINPNAFKLTSIAGAYWRGDERNEMLTRIYGTAFNTKEDLDEHLKKIEEAKARDHRKLGHDLELFAIDDEVGQGLILWLPNGAFVRHKIAEFAFNTYLERGYKPVVTPHIASESLWSHSGHLDFYGENMYNSFGIDDEQYRLKPMNCPLQIKMYNIRPRSYRELPIRWTEMGTVYRYERSGTLHGLTRVRGFTQDDAHIMCTKEQLHKEVRDAIDLTMYVLKTFGFEKFEVNLSIKDKEKNNKEKYVGDDQGWEMAVNTLSEALKEANLEYVIDEGGAVFYGPKIDIKVEDAIGRKWQLSTIQADFNLPSKFNMKYIGEDGKEHTPLMIHRALLGSLERFMGVYIEHTAGAFPVWLAPTQVCVIPIGESHNKYASEIEDNLVKAGFRAEVDNKGDTMQAKIRDAQNKKIPYMIIVGDKEMKDNTVSVRLRDGKNINGINLEEFLGKIKKIDLTKGLNLW